MASGESLSQDSGQLLIFIRFNSQHAFPVEIDKTALVQSIHDEIAKRHDIPPDDFKIIFQGKILDSKSSVQDYDLGEHTVLHAVRRRQTGSRGNSGRSSPAATRSNSRSTSPTLHRQILTRGLNDISELQTAQEKAATCEESKPRLQFYVYCKTCQDVQPGKLRVCCAECKQGTLVLTKEPSQWYDIQGSGRLTGRCHSEECKGKTAEFFFKCANHTTNVDATDRSVGLELVKSNSHEVPCITCLEVLNPVLVFPCTDGHVMCLECFHMYATTKLNDRAFTQTELSGYTLACPAGCDNSLIEDAHHFRILGQDQYERYQRFGAEEFVLQAGGVLCPRPGCGAGILPDEDEPRVVCLQGCGYVFCRECLNDYHEGECTVNRLVLDSDSQGFRVTSTNAQHAKYERQSRETIKKTTHPCPKCKVPVERNGGCMHMTCPRCKFDWCWLCQSEWNRDCQADHWFE